MKKAVVLGGSGLVGSQLLSLLLNDNHYTEVTALVRQLLPLKNKKLKQVVLNFDAPDTAELCGDVLFCCLGSTQKKTPDPAAYRKIDHDYPLTFAELFYKNGGKQYHLVSALGANASSASFYQKLKGETENDIKKIPFDSLYIYQPSLLTGKRNEKRPLESVAAKVMKIIDPLLAGPLKKYRSINATTVAQAIVNQSLTNKKGIFVYPSDKIKTLA